MNNLNTEQSNILKKAREVKGVQGQFTKFIQEEIIDRGYIEFLDNENFRQELRKIDKRFDISIEYLNKNKENDLSKYFVDKDGNLIISEEELNTIPIDDRKDRYVYAKKMEEEEKFDFAKRIYKSIIDMGPDKTAKFYEKYKDDKNVKKEDIKASTYYQAICSYYLCKVKNGEGLTEKEKKEVNKLLTEDKIVIKEVLREGTDIEFILSILGEEIDIETLEKEILPNIKEDYGGEQEERNEETTGLSKTIYTPAEILEIFKGLGDIRKVTLGIGGLDGFVLFTYDNLTIAEKFFKRDTYKDMIRDRAATYLVHKKAKLDLEEATKGQLVEKKNQEKRKDSGKKLILSNNHTSGYRKNLKKSYDFLDRVEFNKKTGKIKDTRRIKKTTNTTKRKVTKRRYIKRKSKEEKEEVQEQGMQEQGVPKQEMQEQGVQEQEVQEQEMQEQDIQEKGTQVMESNEEPMDTETRSIDEIGMNEDEIGETGSSNLGEGEDSEGKEEGKEEGFFSISQRLIKLTDEIGETDKEENDLISELKRLEEQKEKLDEQMNKYRNELSIKIGQNLSIQDKRKIIKDQIKALDYIQNEYNVTIKLEEDCRRKIEENRKRRKQLEEKFNTLLNGDGVDGR